MQTNPFGNASQNIAITQPNQFGQGNVVSNSRDPTESPRAFNFTFDFTKQTSYIVDMTMELQSGRVSSIQTLYADNSNNPSPLLVTVAGTNQPVKIAAGSQQYVAVLASQPCKFTFQSIGSNATAVYVALTNVPMPFASWQPNIATGSGGEALTVGPINAAGVSGPYQVGAGTYGIDFLASNWNAATLVMQKLGGDGVTYVTISGVYAANGSDILLLPSGQYQFLVTGGPPTSLYVELGLVPGGL